MDKQKVVVIKLKKWQIPRLLGAMRLGIWTEDWCAALVQSGINTYDTHSGMWIFSVGTIIDSIKKQTGVDKEDKEYGEYEQCLKEIEIWVDKQCKTNEENSRKRQEEENKKYADEKR